MTTATLIPTPDAAKRNRWQSIILPAVVAILVSTLYAIACWHNQFVYDDHEVIEDQFPVHHVADLVEIFREPHYLNFPYYRPITRSTFAIQKTISGDHPRPFHLFNAILAGAVFLAAFVLLRRPVFKIGPTAALIASTWFCIHPALSECVYPAASGRETLLPIFVILLTTWAYLHDGKRWFWISMGLFAIALLCKEQAVVLPGVFILADFLACKTDSSKPRTRIIRYIPICCIFVAYFALRHAIFGGNTLKLTVMDQPLEPFKSFLYGIQSAILPWMDLHYEPSFGDWFDPRLAMPAVAFCVLLLIVSIIPAKTRRLALFWFGWFVLMQLPTAQLLQQDAQYSERYVALAILAIPALGSSLISQSRRKEQLGLILAAGAIIWVIVLGAITFIRGSYYQDETTFSMQWHATSPQAAGPYDGFGLIAQQQHDPRTAIKAYESALSIDPNSATAHNNLANLLADEGDTARATEHYEWLLNHNAFGADAAATMSNYAQLLGMEAFQKHDPEMRDRAHDLLAKAIQLRPGYAQAHYVSGIWEEAFGTKEQAITEYETALRLKPDLKEAEMRLTLLQPKAASQPHE